MQQLFSQLSDFFSGSRGILAVYLLVLNIVCLILMAFDRVRAREHMFRTPSSVFYVLSLMGGSIGNLVGLLLFRLRARSISAGFVLWIFLIPIAQLLAVLITAAAAGQIRFL